MTVTTKSSEQMAGQGADDNQNNKQEEQDSAKKRRRTGAAKRANQRKVGRRDAVQRIDLATAPESAKAQYENARAANAGGRKNRVDAEVNIDAFPFIKSKWLDQRRRLRERHRPGEREGGGRGRLGFADRRTNRRERGPFTARSLRRLGRWRRRPLRAMPARSENTGHELDTMMNRSRRLCAVALLAAAASCNSYEPRWFTNPTFNNPVGSLTMTLDKSAITLYGSSTGTDLANATLTPADGFSGLVTFSPVGDEHLGIVITPGSVDIEGSAPVTVALTFTATDNLDISEDIRVSAAQDNQSTEAPLQVNPTSPIGGFFSGPAALSFIAGGPVQFVSYSVSGEDVGPLSEADTCAGIATVTPGATSADSAAYEVGPVGVGSCAITITSGSTNGSAPSFTTAVTVTGN